jgi:hypothetical protein
LFAPPILLVVCLLAPLSTAGSAAAAQSGLVASAPGIPQAARDTLTGWRVGGRGGIGVHQMRDDLLSPLRLVGPGADLRLTLARRDATATQRADLRVGFAFDRNRYDHQAAAASWGARYAYLRGLAAGEPRTGFALGPAALLHVDKLYFFDWDDAHLYWMTVAAIGPAAAGEWALGPGVATAALELPTVGLLGRPPLERRRKVDDLVQVSTWFTLPFSALKLAAPPDLIALDARFAFAPSARVRWHYDLSLRTAREPRRAAVLEHLLGLEWTFRR